MLMVQQPDQHLTLWNVGSQQLHVTFDGGRLVSDAGLLAVRAVERPLRVIADLAERLPDPRSPKFIEHSAEALLTQAVYQILAGYPDCNDAHALRLDPLFQILAHQALGLGSANPGGPRRASPLAPLFQPTEPVGCRGPPAAETPPHPRW